MHFYELGQDMIVEIMKNSGPDTLNLIRASKYLYSVFKNNIGAINLINVVELICLIQFPRSKTNKLLQFTSNLYPNHHLYVTSDLTYIPNADISKYIKIWPETQINWDEYNDEHYTHQIAMFYPKTQLCCVLNYGSETGPGCLTIWQNNVEYNMPFDIMHKARDGTLFENTFTFNFGPSWTYNKQECEKYLSLLQNCKIAPTSVKNRIKKHFVDLDRSFYWFRNGDWPEI